MMLRRADGNETARSERFEYSDEKKHRSGALER